MRIPRLQHAAALAAALVATTAVAAGAHEGNPDYRSEVARVTPDTPGITVRVLDHDDALELTNRGDEAVLVYGYENEPYARVLPDGTVQVNEASATVDRAAAGYELASYDLAHGGEEHDEEVEPADPATRTSWVTLDKTGRFAWHDERINWRKAGLPPQVTDRSQETKIADWHVPIRVGAARGAISGTLFWVGEPGGDDGFPVAAAVSLAAIALVSAGAVVLVRRRRRAGE